jgi:hypothetical protein
MNGQGLPGVQQGSEGAKTAFAFSVWLATKSQLQTWHGSPIPSLHATLFLAHFGPSSRRIRATRFTLTRSLRRISAVMRRYP